MKHFLPGSQGQFGNVLPDGKKQVLEQVVVPCRRFLGCTYIIYSFREEPEDNAPDSTLPRNQALLCESGICESARQLAILFEKPRAMVQCSAEADNPIGKVSPVCHDFVEHVGDKRCS